jgi:hypothetical protein
VKGVLAIGLRPLYPRRVTTKDIFYQVHVKTFNRFDEFVHVREDSNYKGSGKGAGRRRKITLIPILSLQQNDSGARKDNELADRLKM